MELSEPINSNDDAEMGPPSALELVVPAPGVWALLALLAILVGKSLSPALLGSFAGFDTLIQATLLAGSGITQLTALLFVLLVIRLSTLLFTRGSSLVSRLVLTSGSAIAVSCAALSATGMFELHEIWYVSLALSCAASALWAGSSGLRFAEFRGPSLMLLTCATSGLLHTAAKVLALASSASASAWGYTVARGLATAGWGSELATLLLALTWTLLGEKKPVLRILAILGFAITTAIAWSLQAKAGAHVVVARALAELASQPQPLIPLFAQNAVEMFALIQCILVLFALHRLSHMRLLVVLLVLSRASFDVPIGGLLALSASLLAVVGQKPGD